MLSAAEQGTQQQAFRVNLPDMFCILLSAHKRLDAVCKVYGATAIHALTLQ